MKPTRYLLLVCMLGTMVTLGCATIQKPRADVGFTMWMKGADYQREFDRQLRNRQYPVKVEGRSYLAENQYRAIFQPFLPGVFYFYSYHGLLEHSYVQKNRELLSRGFKQIHLQTFEDLDGFKRYQATWIRRHH